MCAIVVCYPHDLARQCIPMLLSLDLPLPPPPPSLCPYLCPYQPLAPSIGHNLVRSIHLASNHKYLGFRPLSGAHVECNGQRCPRAHFQVICTTICLNSSPNASNLVRSPTDDKCQGEGDHGNNSAASRNDVTLDSESAGCGGWGVN